MLCGNAPGSPVTTDRFAPNDMRIRPYAPSDWPRVCAIHDAARLDELRLSVGEAAFLTLERAFEDEGLFDGRVDVAEIAGDLAGFVAHTDDELGWLYVDPALSGRGIGRALLRHAIANAGTPLRTEVLEGNEPVLLLYLSEGFAVEKRVEGRLEGHETFAASGFLLVRDGVSHPAHRV